MTINWWTLGLQAFNVLILVWLLSRVFWRPVAKAIATRQDTARMMLDDAKTSQAKADKALAEVITTREKMAEERETLLAEARESAATEAKAAMTEASAKAETVLKAAQTARDREAASARAKAEEEAALLAVDIAGKLLARFDPSTFQSAFLDFLVDAIGRMPSKDRSALGRMSDGIDIVSAIDLDDATKAKVVKAVRKALDCEPSFTFIVDPELVAGFEIRTPHFILRDSWRSDLTVILKNLRHAA
jgi:F-type H+-transporting ATPase subunit b